MSERLVVIGGDAAGMTAASQARSRRGPDDLAILASERGHHTSYAACGIPYFVGDVVHEAERLVARAPEVFRDKVSIDVRLRHEVTAIDAERRTVTVRDLDAGSDSEHEFDQLVVATGATPIRPKLPGADAGGIHGVQVLDDGVALRRRLDGGGVSRAVVVGGGYIGLEMAEALVRQGVEVALVEQAGQPMSTLDPDMGSLVADAMRQMGIALYLEEAATASKRRAARSPPWSRPPGRSPPTS